MNPGRGAAHPMQLGHASEPQSSWVREAVIYIPVYFFLALIQLRVKLLLTPAWFDGTLAGNHAALMRFDYFNNEQSRLLQFLIPELFHRLLGLEIGYAYIVQRWLFVLLVLIGFHFFLRKWFSPAASFGGVLFLAAIMPLTYIDDLQESSSLLLLTFLLALWAIRDHKTISLALVLLVGGLNNETMLIVPFAYFLYNFKSFQFRDLFKLVGKTVLVSLPIVLAVGTIRLITRNQPHLGGAWHLPDNLSGIVSNLQLSPLDYYNARYLFILFIFGAFWVYAVLSWKDKPLFLQRAALMIPFFVAAHLLTGIIHEVRQMLPLAFIIVPMAMFYLFPNGGLETHQPSGA